MQTLIKGGLDEEVPTYQEGRRCDSARLNPEQTALDEEEVSESLVRRGEVRWHWPLARRAHNARTTGDNIETLLDQGVDLRCEFRFVPVVVVVEERDEIADCASYTDIASRRRSVRTWINDDSRPRKFFHILGVLRTVDDDDDLNGGCCLVKRGLDGSREQPRVADDGWDDDRDGYHE